MRRCMTCFLDGDSRNGSKAFKRFTKFYLHILKNVFGNVFFDFSFY